MMDANWSNILLCPTTLDVVLDVLIPLPLSPQGLSFHLGAVLLSLGFITYIEHGTFRRFTTRL